jgi:rhodanese-related sulfurtransferase
MANMTTMSLTDFAALVGPNTVLIDVREPGEYVLGHLPGAVLIPLAQLPGRLAEVPQGIVYVVCRSGNRSKVGAEVLAYNGYDAVSIDGGTQGWIDRGWDVVTGREPR